jgi:calcineurin-like phosphoesterase family protein
MTRYLLSDLHPDHTNIIRYCDRPLEDVDEMNEALVGNWSQTISKDDEVVFIGDLTVSSEFGVFKQWIEQLNGTVQFVLGNHDTYIMPNLDGLTVGE